MVQIDLYTKYEAEGNSWTLGANCASQRQTTLTVEADKIYQESCSLAIGESYELNCNSFAGNGWSGSLLLIESKAYCQNFTSGSKQTATIEIEGKYTLKATKNTILNFHDVISHGIN